MKVILEVVSSYWDADAGEYVAVLGQKTFNGHWSLLFQISVPVNEIEQYRVGTRLSLLLERSEP